MSWLIPLWKMDLVFVLPGFCFILSLVSSFTLLLPQLILLAAWSQLKRNKCQVFDLLNIALSAFILGQGTTFLKFPLSFKQLFVILCILFCFYYTFAWTFSGSVPMYSRLLFLFQMFSPKIRSSWLRSAGKKMRKRMVVERWETQKCTLLTFFPILTCLLLNPTCPSLNVLVGLLAILMAMFSLFFLR